MTPAEERAAAEFGDAYERVMGRPLAGDNGPYLAAAAEIDAPLPDDAVCDDRYMQQAEDDRIGELFGHEPGARRRLA